MRSLPQPPPPQPGSTPSSSAPFGTAPAHRPRSLAGFVLLLATGVLLLPASAARGFGTVYMGGQNGEHEKITRAALACAPNTNSDGSCFEPLSIAELAGHRDKLGDHDGHVGAVGSADTNFSFLESGQHCDSADFLNVKGYPRSMAMRNLVLRDCRQYLRIQFRAGIERAGPLLDGDGDIRSGEASVAKGCSFFLHLPLRGKCNVLESFGRTLHGVQDFYSHSNWSDANPKKPSVDNPPGLNRTAVAPIFNFRSDVYPLLPTNLATGCWSANPLGCRNRISHDDLNKDRGKINERTGVTSSPTTARGKVGHNFAAAVKLAIAETKRQWRDFRTDLLEEHGEAYGNRIICVLTHDQPTQECATTTLVLNVDATLAWRKDEEPGEVRVRISGLPLRRESASSPYKGQKPIEVVDYHVADFDCYTHTYEIKALDPFRVSSLSIETPPKGLATVSMRIDPGDLEEKIFHHCKGDPSRDDEDIRRVYRLGMENLLPSTLTNWTFGGSDDAVYATKTITGSPAEYTGQISLELARPNLESGPTCSFVTPPTRLASQRATFPAAAPLAFFPAWVSQETPAPPIPPAGTAGLEIVTEPNEIGQPNAATVKLDNREKLYVAWTKTKECGTAAAEGLAARNPTDLLYRRTGRQPSLRTYDRKGANGGATDAAQTDLNWNTTKVTDALTYIKETIDSNRPVYVGVNERGKITKKKDKPGLANDGIVDHYLLIHGYRLELQSGSWKITRLYAVNNAAGGGQEGRYPEFTVANNQVRKAATKPNPNPYTDVSIVLEYQLAQVWAYQADLPRVQKMAAWWDP